MRITTTFAARRSRIAQRLQALSSSSSSSTTQRRQRHFVTENGHIIASLSPGRIPIEGIRRRRFQTTRIMAATQQQQPSDDDHSERPLPLTATIDRLKEQSKQLLSSNDTTRTDLEGLLLQWLEALNDKTTSSSDSMSSSSGIEQRMQDLYQAWRRLPHHGTAAAAASDSRLHHTSNSNSSNAPHRIMLQAYALLLLQVQATPDISTCRAYSERALQVMNDWNETLGGHLELAPSLDDFHLLLQVLAAAAAAKSSCNTVAVEKSAETDGNNGDDDNKNDDPIMAASVAMEVFQYLQEAGYSMTPTLYTYRLVTDCLAAAAGTAAPTVAGEPTADETVEGESSTVTESLQLWMNQVMADADRHIKAKSDISDEEQLLLVYILCNAIISSCRHKHEYNDWNKWLRQLQELLAASDTQKQLLITAHDNHQLDELRERLDVTLTHILRMARSLPLAEREAVSEALLEPLHSMNLTRLPTIEHYYRAILLWKGVSGRSASDCRHRLIEQIEAAHDELIKSNGEMEASTTESETWNMLMEANYIAGRLKRVNRIWDELSSNSRVRRNHKTFSIQLKALADAGTVQAAAQAMSIWRKTLKKRMVVLNAQDYASVMVAWSRSRHAQAHKNCQLVFDQLLLEMKSNDSMKPTIMHYMALVSTDRSMTPLKAKETLDGMRNLGVEPDLKFSQMLVKHLSRLGTIDAAEAVDAILNEMEDSETLSPCLSCYVSAIVAWSRTPGGYAKGGTLLDQLEKKLRLGDSSLGTLDSVPYRAIIEAWAKYDPFVAGQEADMVLCRFKQAARDGIAVAPDNKVYTAVMTAHWKSGEETTTATLDRMEELLQEMKESYSSGYHAAKPDAHCITVLLHAYGKSSLSNKAAVAWDLLRQLLDSYRQMGDLDCKPTAHAFAAVLNACAYSRDNSQEAVHIALQVMTTLMDDGSVDPPNSYIYNNFFQVIGRQLDDVDERNRIAQVMFQRCCAEGYMNRRILMTLREFFPDLCRKLPVDQTTKHLNIPPEWKRNTEWR